MKTKKEKSLSQEAQSILNWCRKKKVTCQWVLNRYGTQRTLCMNRGPHFIYSESMTSEKADSITYEEMKKLLVELYKRLKESEE